MTRLRSALLVALFASITASAVSAEQPSSGTLQTKVEKLQAAARLRAEYRIYPDAAVANYRRMKSGGKDTSKPARLFEVVIPVNMREKLTTITLPRNERLKVFAISLHREWGSSTVLNLRRFFTRDGIALTHDAADSSLDNGGMSFPEEAFKNAGSFGNSMRILTSRRTPFDVITNIKTKNTIDCKGQAIPVPTRDRYRTVHLLTTSINGASLEPIRFSYADGSVVSVTIGVPDWCIYPETSSSDDPLAATEAAIRDLVRVKRAVLSNLEVQLGDGATAVDQPVRPVYRWAGEKTTATFTARVDPLGLFPGLDLSRADVLLYAGVDDKGSIIVNGGVPADFYWEEGRVLLAHNEAKPLPVQIEIHGKNEIGEGRLLRAEVGVEWPGINEYLNLIDDLRNFRLLTEGTTETERLEKVAMAAFAESLPVEALITADADAVSAAAQKLRASLGPLAEYGKARRIHLIGYSHIDLAWLWPLQETIESVIPLTFGQALKFMDEYKDFRFSMTQAQQYAWVADLFPEMDAEIQKRVKSGQWEILGGMWCEPDCNLPNGESFVRQVLYGKRYFQEKFGVDVRVAMNPDSFGYTWQLPQIYRKSGFDAFITQKIGWNDTWHFPHKLFWWESPDGTRLLSYFPVGSYSEELHHRQMAEQMRTFETATTGVKDMLVIYGVGDHGGGPTRAMIERGKALENSPILPQAKMSTSQAYFDELAEKGVIPSKAGGAASGGAELPVWKNELYLERHRGTYTTNADAKDGNRRSERLMYNAELAAALAWPGGGSDQDVFPANAAGLEEAGGPHAEHPVPAAAELTRGLYGNLPEETTYPAKLFEKAWKDICLLQMHDILPGSGIYQNYAESQRLYEDLRTTVTQNLRRSLAIMAKVQPGGNSPKQYAVYNLLPWERTGICTIDSAAPLALADGSVPVQAATDDSGKSRLVQVTVPACGYVVLQEAADSNAKPIVAKIGNPSSRDVLLDNAFLEALVDAKTGNLKSLTLASRATDSPDSPGGAEFIGQYARESRVVKMPTNKPEKFSDSRLLPADAGLQANILQFHADHPRDYDAWEIGFTGRLDESGTCTLEAQRKAAGLFSEVTVVREYGKSRIRQTYRLWDQMPWLDVVNEIEWHERHVMLKAAFPLSFRNKWANYEIPFGAIDRPAERTAPEEIGKYEHSAIQWGNMDDPSGAKGLAILTMNKYGFDAKDNVLRLSLLRGPKSPNEKADKGRPEKDEGHHVFSYAVMPHAGTWKEADVVRHAQEYNFPLIPSELRGAAPKTRDSLLSVEPANVVLASMKKAEDDDALIIRLNEGEGSDAVAKVRLPWTVASAELCDLMEKTAAEGSTTAGANAIKVTGTELDIPVKRFEIVTVKVKVLR